MHLGLVRAERGRRDRGVELVGLGLPRRHHRVEVRERVRLGRGGRGQPVPQDRLAARGDDRLPVRGDLGARVGVDRAGLPVDDPPVHAVLLVRRGVRLAGDPLGVGLVLAEQQLDRLGHVQPEVPERLVDGVDGPAGRVARDGLQGRLGLGPAPRPRVAEPQGRQQVDRRVLRTPVAHRDPRQQVRRPGLGVVDLHVEVPAPVEHAGVQQLVLGVVEAALAVGADQVVVGEGRVRVLVPPPHPRVGRGVVGVEVVLLDVLPVVALRVRQPEEALLEDRVLAVPQGQAQAQLALVVADAGHAVLAPAVGPGSGLVVGEVVPGVAVVAVVLADGAPLPLAQVGAPLPPADALPGLPQPRLLSRQLHARAPPSSRSPTA